MESDLRSPARARFSDSPPRRQLKRQHAPTVPRPLPHCTHRYFTVNASITELVMLPEKRKKEHLDGRIVNVIPSPKLVHLQSCRRNTKRDSEERRSSGQLATSCLLLPFCLCHRHPPFWPLLPLDLLRPEYLGRSGPTPESDGEHERFRTEKGK